MLSLRAWLVEGEKPHKIVYTGDWRDRARRYLEQYSRAMGIETPRLVFGFEDNGKPLMKNVPARLLGKARTFEGYRNYYDRNGVLVKSEWVGKTVFLTPKFEKMFKQDPELADLVLRFVIAHELAHILMGHSPHSRVNEEVADRTASRVTGIKIKDFTKAVFTLIPYRNPEKQRKALEYAEKIRE